MRKHYIGLAWRELLAQRVTSALILAAVILSTMMTAVIGQSVGVLAAMRQQQAIALGGDRYASFIQQGEEQVAALRADPRLSFVGTYLPLGTARLDRTLTLGLNEYQEDVTAIYPAWARLKAGRLPEAPLELVLPEDMVQYLGLTGELGEKVTLSLSKALRHGIETQTWDYTADFTLVGITEADYLGYAAGVVTGIAGTGTGAAVLPESYRYYNVDIRTAGRRDFYATVQDLIERLGIHQLDTIYNIPYLDALGIPYQLSDTYEKISGLSDSGFPALLAAGALVGVLLLLAAGLVIYNILWIAVSRRIGQYGVLRAMGGEKRQIYAIVAAQVLLLCGLGIPAGLALGALSARGILTAVTTGLISPDVLMARDEAELARLIAENSGGKGWFLLASAAVTLIFALLAALPAARYAAGVSPVTAMSGQRVRIRRRNRKIRRIRSFERHCAWLNLSRSRGRTAITILSLTMSITVFVALQSGISLLDTASQVTDHLGDYSVVNEGVGFSPAELAALEDRADVASVAALQLSVYTIDENARAMGIDVDCTFHPGETFQVAGLSDGYCDAFFGRRLDPGTLARLKAGEGCVVRNPVPLVFDGAEIPRTEVRAGESLAVAGQQVPVLYTIDGYDSYISVGNGGFVNGVQVIGSPALYTRLTGESAFHELKPTLAPDADRAAFDTLLDALARRIPGTSWLSYQETDRQSAESFRQIRLLAWGLILFVGLIGLLNVMGTAYTNIHTRVAELGMQRAIGMSAGGLRRVLLWEGAYYGIIASVMGSVSGYLCVLLLEQTTGSAQGLPALPLIPMAEASALAVAACLLATCVPLKRVSRMSIVASIETVE